MAVAGKKGTANLRKSKGSSLPHALGGQVPNIYRVGCEMAVLKGGKIKDRFYRHAAERCIGRIAEI